MSDNTAERLRQVIQATQDVLDADVTDMLMLQDEAGFVMSPKGQVGVHDWSTNARAKWERELKAKLGPHISAAVSRIEEVCHGE